MTPAILWKFSRLGSFDISPDGSTVIYTITDVDIKTETRRTNIFRISSSEVILYRSQQKGAVLPGGSIMVNPLLLLMMGI